VGQFQNADPEIEEAVTGRLPGIAPLPEGAEGPLAAVSEASEADETTGSMETGTEALFESLPQAEAPREEGPAAGAFPLPTEPSPLPPPLPKLPVGGEGGGGGHEDAA
jgi:hypothetical protein